VHSSAILRACAAAGFVALALVSQTAPRTQVGPLPDGSFLLNSGWRVKPVGRQLPLDTFPMSCALSKDGRFLAVLNAGYRPPSISVIDVKAEREVGRAGIPDGWLGLTFSPDGHTLWVGGGSKAAVFEYAFNVEDGSLRPGRTFTLADNPTAREFIGDVAVSPDGHLLLAASLYRDEVLVVNTQSGTILDRFKTHRRPYRILFHPSGKSFFVTSWADGTMQQLQVSNGFQIGVVRLGAHPTDMIWSDRKPDASGEAAPESQPQWQARMFISSANTNNVYVVGVGESTLTNLETINLGMTARHPLGMTPSALAITPDQRMLYTVCSDANAVAAADISELRTHVVGFIPVGWYPTAARVAADGRLFVLNGRGARSYPNPGGPSPLQQPEPVHVGIREVEYVGRIQKGSLSIIPPPDDATLATYTNEALENSPYRDEKLDGVMGPPGNPIPLRPGGPTPIQHVLYIVKENRTYDQVLGDIGKGASDPSLTLFGEQITPNQHKLARDFVLLDNFYVNGDVSADGHNWSTAAIAPDYVEKMWPNSYAKRRRTYDYEGGEPAAFPPSGYLWTNASAHGVSMRNYGYFVSNRPEPGPGGIQVGAVRDNTLAQCTNLYYRGFDLNFPDVERAKVFLSDLAFFAKSGNMPRLMFMRLGNDHTYGMQPGRLSPLSLAADNDYALGMIIEALSKSVFWKNTAVFVVEDDAQNGADHIDSHRSTAYLVSPYVRRGFVDSTMYNTTSVLRTMELLLGLNPLTHFDAGATPMFNSFTPSPNFTAWQAEKPRTPLDLRNPASPERLPSESMNFEEADQIDDDALNAELWRGIRGTDPPAPTSSFFSR